MLRLLGQKTGSCFQRCVGMDAINAVDSTTFEIDQKHGTEYHQRFRKWLLLMQKNDWTVDGAMTDPKGDRSLAPSQQKEPDMFLHVVAENEEGIIVRGAKIHQTGALNSHEILIMPTISMTEADKDYAISFAIPADSDGLIYIYGRQSCDTRKLEGCEIDLGNAKYGGHEALVIFENVFVPWERVFLFKEHHFPVCWGAVCGYHRQSYGLQSQ